MVLVDQLLDITEIALRNLPDDDGRRNMDLRKSLPEGFPVIVTLCGSTRFKDAFVKAQFTETMAGRIVLTIGCTMHSDPELGIREDTAEKAALDQLHFRKIELSDEILVLNVGGYVGSSTRNEIAHAIKTGKKIRWLEPDKALGAVWVKSARHDEYGTEQSTGESS